MPIPKHEFPEQFSNFCFNSLFIRNEVIVAMVQIREECNKVMAENRIWQCNLNKIIRFDEFK